MSDFDPGPGWREANEDEYYAAERSIRLDDPDGDQYWVLESPVPPLPTEPNTVIRVDMRPGTTEMMIGSGMDWHGVFDGAIYTDSELRDLITGFRVLAEPCAVTAKAVLAAVADMNRLDDDDMNTLRNMFGVAQ